jgi:hypothetical protein
MSLTDQLYARALCMIAVVRAVLAIVLCACTSGEPTHAPEIAVHSEAPRRELDVPALASAVGTMDPTPGAPIITLTGAPGEVAAQRAAIPELGPALVAIGPKVTFRAVAPSLDALVAMGKRDIGVFVTVANVRRMLVIESPRAMPSQAQLDSVALISAGTSLELGGAPIDLDAIPATLKRLAPGRIVVDPSPDVTMQRLAEVIAACGGLVTLGRQSLPSVVGSGVSP